MIYTLGEIVETRSKETAHHVKRVSEICYLLARKCGIDEKTAEMLKLASPMHDIGKIGVPEAILHKPGKLTDKEFEIIKAHAETGYEMGLIITSTTLGWGQASVIALLFKFTFKQSSLSKA
ncbi:MAG: HD domain-containing protein [Thermodesulfobacteriota bacterium]|nr:HD domain-containing protein [Thermodesulfobacteriota bacterium]